MGGVENMGEGKSGGKKKETTSIFTEPRQANGAKQKNKRKKQGK